MTVIQIRRGITTDWATSNPVLTAGEPGIDLTTKQFKIGDGVATWSALPLVSIPILTTAQRTALPGASLYRGLTIFNSDTGGIEVYYGATTLWRAPWNTAWGEITKTMSTATTSLAAGTTDLVTVTFTAVANRRYKLSGYVRGIIGTAATGVGVSITDNVPSTTVHSDEAPNNAQSTGNIFALKPWGEVNPPAGSVTYRLRVSLPAGTGVFTLQPNNGLGNGLYVEDIGPNGNAPAA